jgi:hypothetical protein
MPKLDAYQIKRHHLIVEPSMSGNDFSVHIHPRWSNQHHGIKIKNSEELRELYEFFGSILLDHDYEMEQKLLKQQIHGRPF